MTNNLAGLNTKLNAALRDTGYATWATGQIDELVTEAVDSLWPRFARALDPTTATIVLVTDTYFYSLPTGCIDVSRVDMLDANAEPLETVHGRAWEVTGDALSGTGKLHVGPTIVEGNNAGSLQLHGYGKYDVTTNLIPNDFVALVLARARAEAYRQLGANREQFQGWLVRNQTQNVSVTELLHLINEADAEADKRTARAPRTWRLPVSGRVG